MSSTGVPINFNRSCENVVEHLEDSNPVSYLLALGHIECWHV